MHFVTIVPSLSPIIITVLPVCEQDQICNFYKSLPEGIGRKKDM